MRLYFLHDCPEREWEIYWGNSTTQVTLVQANQTFLVYKPPLFLSNLSPNVNQTPLFFFFSKWGGLSPSFPHWRKSGIVCIQATETVISFSFVLSFIFLSQYLFGFALTTPPKDVYITTSVLISTTTKKFSVIINILLHLGSFLTFSSHVFWPICIIRHLFLQY